MNELPPFLRADSDGVILSIKLQPRASLDEIAEPLGNELRVKVTAPPVDSAANEALLKLLAKEFRCPRGQIQLLRGRTSRHKAVKLRGISPEAIVRYLPREKSSLAGPGINHAVSGTAR